MSSPYVHRPSTPASYQFDQTPYYYHTPQSSHTPFLPDISLSPFSRPGSLPGSPHLGNAQPNVGDRIPFPSSAYDDSYDAWEYNQRQRRPSWHGSQPPWLHPGYPSYSRDRRHSFGNPAYHQQLAGWTQMQNGLLSPQTYFSQTQFYVNPWINAEAPRSDFFFDLSAPSFAPLRLYGPGQSAYMTMEELMEPAFHPPLTHVVVVSDLIPQWPINLEFNQAYGGHISPNPYGGFQPPPITLRDVLWSVYQKLNRQISHLEWGRLTRAEETEIAKAFTRRCRAIPSMTEHEHSKGVKRIDFLKGKTRMVGLLRGVYHDGVEHMKLITS